jgi:hypothetical protein
MVIQGFLPANFSHSQVDLIFDEVTQIQALIKLKHINAKVDVSCGNSRVCVNTLSATSPG